MEIILSLLTEAGVPAAAAAVIGYFLWKHMREAKDPLEDIRDDLADLRERVAHIEGRLSS